MSTSAGSTGGTVPYLDVLDPAFDFHSPEAIAAQEESWHAESPLGPLVLRYAEAQEILRDRGFDHNGKGFLAQNGVVDGPVYDWFVPMIVNHDGEEHRRLRGLVNKAFTPRMVEGLRPFIRAWAEELTERLRAEEVCEFVEDFSDPLPLAVMCRLLGVPAEDYEFFRRWSPEIGLVFGLANGGDVAARVERAVVALNDYVDGLIKDKQAHPGEDLSSALVAAWEGGGRVTRDELRNLLVTLVFAAHDTTRHQLANAIVAFAEHPGQWELLARDPGLAPRAVEELFRYRPSTTILFRYAIEDLEFHGLGIAKGMPLTVLIPTAQRDPRVHENAHAFDITAPRTATPLQFGGGPHHCLGAALARAELSEALPALAARLGPPSLAGPVAWTPPIGIYGALTVPLRFA
ncbi:cytochrome P450 [Sphaerisporangium siamense]|uniref:Cytochrome P450 n=1 Tax=Sphaerisporangium siamense TaxID=795645 RepID=A0A7W7G7Y3_9ACTN|nr:cytochrome P450 [Sphaerisporangium siamense]MBB4699024.1 cytochrome P450 [Sphaerisporangium siamense]